MMVAGVNATRASQMVLKSILQHRSSRLQLHLLVDHRSRAILRAIFAGWQLAGVDVAYYLLLDHTAEVAWVRTVHESGVFGLSKLTYERMLPDVPRLLAIDTDIAFAADIQLLWRHFAAFRPEQMIGAVEQQSDWYLNKTHDARRDVVWPANGRGINTGVLLLDLAKMRAHDWRRRWTELTRRRLAHVAYTGLADQDVFNLVLTVEPQLLYPLPCQWNLQIHNHSHAAACFRSAFLGAVHWNSPQKLAADHPQARFFRDLYWRTVALNGYRLRRLPPACAVQAPAGPNSPLEREDAPHGLPLRPGAAWPAAGDLCYDLRVAAARAYRVHPNLYSFSKFKRIFRCRLANVTHLPLDLTTKVLASSHVIAQHRYFKYVETLRSRLASQGASLPDELAAVCDELDAAAGRADRAEVTLVVHLSMDRTHLLPRLLRLWDGPLSLAIYLGDAELEALHRLLERLPNLKLRDELLVHAVFADGSHYPVNLLRNIGIEQATTRYILMMDADFVPSPQMHDRLKTVIGAVEDEHKRKQLAIAAPDDGDPNAPKAGKTLFVVPAFESLQYSFTMPESKAALEAAFRRGDIKQFRVDDWPQGHDPTDYERWFQASAPYTVRFATHYEPYFAAEQPLPAYDPRLVGFGWNKVAHIEALAALEYRFLVVPDVFLVHTVHAASPDLTEFRSSARYKYCMEQLHIEAAAEVGAGGPDGQAGGNKDSASARARAARQAAHKQQEARLRLERELTRGESQLGDDGAAPEGRTGGDMDEQDGGNAADTANRHRSRQAGGHVRVAGADLRARARARQRAQSSHRAP